MKRTRKSANDSGPRPLQFILNRMIGRLAREKPEVFDRLGPHTASVFLIDPDDLPFCFLLRPSLENPHLSIVRKTPQPRHDSAIRGKTLALMAMIDGRIDGDALFFSRKLSISGNVAATVALRNALDDLEPSALENLTPRPLRPFLGLGRRIARRIAHVQDRAVRPA